MYSLFIFILIFSFSVGITTYILALMLFFKKKSPLERYFLIILSFYLIIMLISTVIFYLEPILRLTGFLHFILFMLSRLSTAGLVLFMVLFIHKLLDFAQTPESKRLVLLLLGFWSAAFLGLFAYSYLKLNLFRESDKVFDASDPLLYSAVFYIILLFFLRNKKVKDSPLLRITRSFLIIALVITPTFLLDDLQASLSLALGHSSVQVRLRFFPLYYLVFNGFLLYYGFKYFLDKKAAKHGQGSISAGFLSKYKITTRERELIDLLIEGYSNKMIGRTLFISPATVRNHLHNIFEKTGASNRVELIRLCGE